MGGRGGNQTAQFKQNGRHYIIVAIAGVSVSSIKGGQRSYRSWHRVQQVQQAYSTTQHPPPSPFSKVRRAARVAASKTSSTPSPLKLEHSRYRLAPMSRAIASPSCSVTNRMDFLRISSIATGSSRRSFLRPTRIVGTPVHNRVASSIHYRRSVSVYSSTCC